MGWKSCVSILAPTVQLYRNWLGTLRWGRSGLSSAPEASGTALARGKFLDHVQLHLHHRHDDQLRDAVHRVDGECLFRAVPHRHHHLPLVVGVDEAHQVPEHDAVFVPEPRAGQHDRGKSRVRQMNGNTARNELRCAWRASTIFGARGSSCTPSSSKSVSALVSLPKVWCARFAARSGIPFFLRFACAFAFRSSVSAANPTQNGPFASAATSPRISGLGASSTLRLPLPRLILCGLGSTG